eukprot:1527854-Amphidinium_carterae.2
MTWSAGQRVRWAIHTALLLLLEARALTLPFARKVSWTFIHPGGGPWNGAEARSFARVHPMYRLASAHGQHSTHMPPL